MMLASSPSNPPVITIYVNRLRYKAVTVPYLCLVYADFGVSKAYSRQKQGLQDRSRELKGPFAPETRLVTRSDYRLGRITSGVYVPTLSKGTLLGISFE